MTRYTVSETPFAGFERQVQVSGCAIWVGEKILLLERAKHCSQPGCWSLPAGKVESGESVFEGCLREVLEETGLRLDPALVVSVKTLYIRAEGWDYEFHIYVTELPSYPSIHLDPREHCGFLWISPEEAKRDLALIKGGQEVMDVLLRSGRKG